jgi:dienelactone hydrolase
MHRIARLLPASLILILLGQSTVRADFKPSVQKVTTGKKRITVEVYTPTVKGKHPAVVLLHGSGGLRDQTLEMFQEFAMGLANEGYVALIPHYFESTGHSPGKRPRQGDRDAWVKAVQDVIDAASKRREVNPDRIGLFGLSMGSGLMFWPAAHDARIKTIVSFSGPTSFTRSAGVLPPTLILHGANDESTPASYAQKFADALKAENVPSAIHIYPDTGHNFPPDQFVDVARRSLQFFDLHLREAGPRKLKIKATEGSKAERKTQTEDGT